MKTIIAGSRSIDDPQIVWDVIAASGFKISQVVSGCARGVDKMGEGWAEDHGIPVVRFPAFWSGHGKKAGIMRNEDMGNYAEALIAVWDGESRGTAHMIEYARQKGLAVSVALVHNLANENDR